ncbi:MAG: carbonic anhydrase [Planctomycetota bacterium]|nr:MAG: carbonic anhydrase [Planctomycetota bacterium]REJ90617.1 MAG: carbonic anhydrase [Planctomycetota bacterium]REK24449.1 MAG: carbonic anhydrase [Planctomycetota bacterium]REK38638.1 MAG: carbonic anhydrase [Planctomycetota bacterium]
MKQIVDGIRDFQANVFKGQQKLFEELAAGQHPEVLFITCSDSRIDPNLITQTHPGELFVIRNAGNIVPPYSSANGGEAATIEYAVKALKVQHIVVCGHSKCGAMQGLLNPDGLAALPVVAEWLGFAAETASVVGEKFRDLSGAELLDQTIAQNVLVQLKNLRTHPSVADALGEGGLTLHGWVYQFETGTITAYDPVDERFASVTEVPADRLGLRA